MYFLLYSKLSTWFLDLNIMIQIAFVRFVHSWGWTFVCRKYWFEGYRPKPQGGGGLIMYYRARNFHNLLPVTRARRNKNGQKQLLLSILAPHQKLKKSTVAGWVKAILGSAGINQTYLLHIQLELLPLLKLRWKVYHLRIFWNEVIDPINQYDKSTITNLFQMSQLNSKMY